MILVRLIRREDEFLVKLHKKKPQALKDLDPKAKEILKNILAENVSQNVTRNLIGSGLASKKRKCGGIKTF